MVGIKSRFRHTEYFDLPQHKLRRGAQTYLSPYDPDYSWMFHPSSFDSDDTSSG